MSFSRWRSPSSLQPVWNFSASMFETEQELWRRKRAASRDLSSRSSPTPLAAADAAASWTPACDAVGAGAARRRSSHRGRVDSINSWPATSRRRTISTTCSHALLHGMHSIKAGDISRTLGWTDLLRHEYVLALEPEVRPVLAEVLRREPRQATTSTRAATARSGGGARRRRRLHRRAAARGRVAGAAQRRRAHAGRRGGAVGQHRGARDAPRGVPGRRARGAPAAPRRVAALPGAPINPRALRGALGSGGGGGGDGRRPVDEGERPRNGAAGAAPTCAEGGGWDVEAPPTAAARAACGIDQRASITADELLNEYFPQGAAGDAARRDVARRALRVCARRAGGGGALQPAGSAGDGVPQPDGPALLRRVHDQGPQLPPAVHRRLKTLPICVKKPGGPVNATAGVAAAARPLPHGRRQPAAPRTQQAVDAPRLAPALCRRQGLGRGVPLPRRCLQRPLFGTKHWVLTPPRYAGITGEASTEWRTTIKPKMPEGLSGDVRAGRAT